MSRFINISDEKWRELAASMVEEMKKKAKNIKGKFTYEISAPSSSRTATVFFEPEAFVKMLSLVMVFDKEVGWYCTCHRDEHVIDTYIIDDVLVFPQETTGVTVDSDDEKRTEWFDSLPVGVLTNIKCDCHSHVNMGTSPSGTDDADMQSVLDNLTDDGFRIFMIWNKKMEHSCKIFDLKENLVFETADVTVGVIGMDLDDFLADAKSMVKPKTYYSPTRGNFITPTRTTFQSASQYNADKNANKKSKKNEIIEEEDFDMDELYDSVYGGLGDEYEDDDYEYYRMGGRGKKNRYYGSYYGY